jgi:hypothetical protein
MKPESSQQIFEKYSNVKVHDNPSGGSRVVPSVRRDVTTVIVLFAILRLRQKQTASLNNINQQLHVNKTLFFFSVAGMASLRQHVPASPFNKHDLWNDSILFHLFITTVTPLRNNTRRHKGTMLPNRRVLTE